jgi:hypothetical protein
MSLTKVIGSFKLGGASWTVKLDTSIEEDNRYEYNVSACCITLNSKYQGRVYSNQALEKNLWEAIFRSITCDTMYYTTEITKSIRVSYSTMFLQAIQTLILNDWDGTFQLGFIEYYVSPDNDRCHKDNVFGCHYPVEKKIILSTISPAKEILPDGFIWQTFYHELLHAIANELGNDNTELNSERFVNILSFFLHEVKSTLDFNIPE